MDIRNNLQALQQIFAPGSVDRTRSGKAQDAPASASAEASLGADQTTVSSAALYASQSAALPEVRMNLVNSIQAALAAGSYHVDSAAVASKLISHMLGD